MLVQFWRLQLHAPRKREGRAPDDDVVFGAPLFPTIKSRRSLDPLHRQDYRRYAGELHTRGHPPMQLWLWRRPREHRSNHVGRHRSPP
jgi:hypothetical protein